MISTSVNEAVHRRQVLATGSLSWIQAVCIECKQCVRGYSSAVFRFRIRDPELFNPWIWDRDPKIRDQDPEIHDPDPEIQDPDPEIRDPDPEIRILESWINILEHISESSVSIFWC